MRHGPAHSTVVAYVALFVALGGVGYAALKIPANSVGTAQLRNNAVTPAKLAKAAQPLSATQLRDVVEQVVTDPSTHLEITVKAQQGDKGDTGPRGPQGDAGKNGTDGAQGIQGVQGVKGDKGDTGDMGPQGLAGHAMAFGYAPAGNSSGSVTGASWTHAGSGIYCFTVPGAVSLTVTPDTTATVAVAPPNSTAFFAGCSGSGKFQVLVLSEPPGSDVGLYFAAN